MTVLLVLIFVFLLFIFGFLFMALFVLSRAGKSAAGKEKEQPPAATLPSFKWRWIAFPVVILLLTIVMVVFYYGNLPAEVVYHFTDNGGVETWTTRGMLACWTLLPQVLLVLLAMGITLGVSRLGVSIAPDETSANMLRSLQIVMSNMIVLPQLILSFAMLNTFSYNAYDTELIPLWLAAVIIMFIGSVILGIFFIRAIGVVRRASKEDSHQDNS